MNLYAIMFEHYAPKDIEEGINKFLLANSDEEVYEYLFDYACWCEHEQEGLHKDDDGERLDDNGDHWKYFNEDGDPETFKDRMIRLNGLMFDDDHQPTDLYYGATVYGWRLVSERVDVETIKSNLKDLVVSV